MAEHWSHSSCPRHCWHTPHSDPRPSLKSIKDQWHHTMKVWATFVSTQIVSKYVGVGWAESIQTKAESSVSLFLTKPLPNTLPYTNPLTPHLTLTCFFMYSRESLKSFLWSVTSVPCQRPSTIQWASIAEMVAKSLHWSLCWIRLSLTLSDDWSSNQANSDIHFLQHSAYTPLTV